MTESVLREKLILAVRDLRKEGLLDWTGGALSLRLDEFSMLITPGGSARRRWKLSEEELLTIEFERPTLRTGEARPPIGVALHSHLYRHLPDMQAIVHTHAGACYTASCLAPGGMPELPPTAHLGAIKTLGVVSDVPTLEITDQPEWVERITIPEVTALFPEWASAMQNRGVAVLDYEHGAYSFGKHLDATLRDLACLEASARLWMWSSVHPNVSTARSRPTLMN